MYLYLSLALTICAGIGFAYGLYRFFQDESALYVRMIIFGVGCAMLGRLFETLLFLVNGELGSGFNVGMLGIIGSFLFFFSANYHLKHLIIDDVSFGLIRSIRSYNLLSLVYALLCMSEVLVECFNLPTVCIVIVYILECIVLLVFVPVLERGVKKWTT